MIRFIVGAIAGGVAMWLWGEEIMRYATDGSREMRKRAADTLQSVESRTGEMIETAKDQLHSTLQAGQDAVRPRAF